MSDPIEVEGQKYFHEEYVKELRDEAAKPRTSKDDAVAAAKAEVETEWKSKYDELEALKSTVESEVDSSRLEVVKLKAALEAGIDSDKVVTFAGLLQGQNEDDLKSHADEVKTLFVTSEPAPAGKQPATDPTQGSGNHKPLNGDPLLEDIKRIVGVR